SPLIRRPPSSTPVPYTTLFRSGIDVQGQETRGGDQIPRGGARIDEADALAGVVLDAGDVVTVDAGEAVGLIGGGRPGRGDVGGTGLDVRTLPGGDHVGERRHDGDLEPACDQGLDETAIG